MDKEEWFFDTFSLFDIICWYTVSNDSVKADASFQSSVNNDFKIQGCTSFLSKFLKLRRA